MLYASKVTAQNEHWRAVSDMLAQLEFCADHDGYMPIDQAKARILVDEIHQLRLGRNVTVELPSDRTIDRVPPVPDREGMQFEDREGNVWTWTRWSELPDEPRRNSGGHNQLVRETADGGDEILPWVDAWREHGPLWLLPDVAATGQLALRAQMVVNGRRYQVRVAVDEFYWEHYGQDFHEHMKADLRRKLVDGIVAELDPQVSVQRKPKRLRKWEADLQSRYVPPSPGPVSPAAEGEPWPAD